MISIILTQTQRITSVLWSFMFVGCLQIELWPKIIVLIIIMNCVMVLFNYILLSVFVAGPSGRAV
jgi:hypothetical protein